MIEEFLTPTGEKKEVVCNWYNNIRSTQKEEKKEDLRLKKLKQFEKHDIKYDKTGEPLEYKNGGISHERNHSYPRRKCNC